MQQHRTAGERFLLAGMDIQAVSCVWFIFRHCWVYVATSALPETAKERLVEIFSFYAGQFSLPSLSATVSRNLRPSDALSSPCTHSKRLQAPTVMLQRCEGAVPALAALLLFLGLLARHASARAASFVVETGSMRITAPPQIAGAHDSAIGDVSGHQAQLLSPPAPPAVQASRPCSLCDNAAKDSMI